MVNIRRGKALNGNDRKWPWDKIYPTNFKFYMEQSNSFLCNIM